MQSHHLFIALCVFILFMGSVLYFVGDFVAPFDDVYIFIRYARNLAKGDVFSYNRDKIKTPGVSSLLYYLFCSVIGVFPLITESFVALLFIAGLILYVATAYFVYEIDMILFKNKLIATVALLLFLVSGRIAFAFFCGMDTALFVFLSVFCFYLSLKRELSLLYYIGMLLLGYSRPEGIVLALVFILITLYNKDFPDKKHKIFSIIIIVLIILQFFFFWTLTGKFLPTTSRKVYLFENITNFEEGIRRLFSYLIRDIQPVPGSVPFSIIILFIFVFRNFRNPATRGDAARLVGFSILPLTLFLIIGIPAHLGLVYRYLTFSYVFATILFCEIFSFTRLKPLKTGIVLVSVLIITLPYFSILFGRSARNINDGLVSAGKYIKKHYKKQKSILLGDAGAIAVYSGKKVYDMVGLVTPDFGAGVLEGSGSVFEKLEKMSESPELVVYYPNRLNVAPTHKVILDLKEFFLMDNVGLRDNKVNLAKLDLSLLKKGALPVSKLGKDCIKKFKIIDELDIADIESEASHDYYFNFRTGVKLYSYLVSGRADEQSEYITDGARLITYERFRLKLKDTKKSAYLVIRYGQKVRPAIILMINNLTHFKVKPYASKGDLLEAVIRLNPMFFDGEELFLEFESLEGEPYVITHYWLCQ